MQLMPVRTALKQTIKNQFDPNIGLQAIDFYKAKIKSTGGRFFPLPSVVRSPVYVRPKGKKVPFSRKNLFLRDNFTCQYCGHEDFTGESLTYDHVIPRAIWKNQNHKKTPTDWLNIVACCKRCNTKKANRTPQQAGMKLKVQPFEPNPHNHLLGFSPWMKIDPTWEIYLPKSYKILLDKVHNGV